MTDSNPSYLASPSAGGDRSGDLLRRAREAQGFSLAQLASQIKVSPSKLEALEQGQHDRLGDSNFTRALALTVCRTLRMDATEVAMHSFGGMQEMTASTCRSQRRGDLLPDQAGLSHAVDDDVATARQQHGHGVRERFVQSSGQAQQRVTFLLEDGASDLQRWVRRRSVSYRPIHACLP